MDIQPLPPIYELVNVAIMGNRATTESNPAAVCEDLLASLPPELVLNILSYLDSKMRFAAWQ